jgi:hypothetical protein
MGRIGYEVGNIILPRSFGMEIETETPEPTRLKTYLETLEGMLVIPDDYKHEMRFRFPTGLEGIRLLYKVSNGLRKFSSENTDASIHYHIDFTDTFSLVNDTHIDYIKDWVLTELDSWNYQRTYNARNVNRSKSAWLKFHSGHKTLEFRIGNCVFDFDKMLKEVEHASYIAEVIRAYVFNDSETIDNHNKKVSKLIPNQIIKNRVKIMY